MQQQVEAARHAWRLWNDETTAGSVAALLLVGVFAYPLVRQWWRYRRAAR